MLITKLFFADNTREQLVRLKLRLIALTLIISIPCIYFFMTYQDVNIATIQGKILKQPIALIPFNLKDQDNKDFTNKNLFGKWHIISFGYSQCPDVCPTTLMTMVQFSNLLTKNEYNDTNFVFYSVDPLRDSSAVLSTYMDYFDTRFIALRSDIKSGTNFEESLGIKVLFSGSGTGKKNYKVSHNLFIFAINPNAALQAVFFPEKNSLGLDNFDHQRLYLDFVAVKDHFKKYLTK